MLYKKIVKPLLFAGDTEKAHNRTLKLASRVSRSRLLQASGRTLYGGSDKGLSKTLMGIDFPNPIGLAAGFDKNGHTAAAMAALGFGFIEIGSITAKASPGNPLPRLFRLPQDRSVINRMGLNNDGAEVVTERLSKTNLSVPLGINIAKTNDPAISGDRAIEDYQISFSLAQKAAGYITVNISCPNTEDGKTFEEPGALRDLLAGLQPSAAAVPVLVKFSVDVDAGTLEKLVHICEDFGISGYVATNTSSERQNLTTPAAALQSIGKGGLSGAAIAGKSTQIVGQLYDILRGSKPIIGVGGIDSPQQAVAKLNAGADLLQLYTGLIYEGPGLIKRIKKGIRRHKAETA